MPKWLAPSRSGLIYRNAAGRVYTGTAGVPVFFEDADVSGALVDGWSYANTQALPAQGALTPTIASYAADPFTGKATAILDTSGNTNGFAPVISQAGVMKDFSATPNVGTANFTFCIQVPFAQPYYGMRVIFQNNDAAAVLAVGGASVASVPTANNSGSGLTFTNITVNGSTTFNVPQASGSGANIVPGFVESDPIFIAPVARSDAGANYLAQIRVFVSLAPTFYAVGAGTQAALQAASGKEYSVGFIGGSALTGASSATMSQSNTVIPIGGVRAFFSNYTKTVAAVGDSLCAGQGSSGGANGAIQQACKLLSSPNGTVYVPSVYGVPGAIHASFVLNAPAVLAQKPTYLVFWANSPNDTQTQALIDKSWAETLYLIDQCGRNGVIPIVCNSGPVNAWYQTASDTLRVAQNARVASLPSTVRTVDVNSVIENPAIKGRILPAYDSGDGLHYSDAGYAAIANLIAAKL